MRDKPFGFALATVATVILTGSLLWSIPAVEAGTQCLPKSECQQLRFQLKLNRGQLGEQRQELQQTRQQIRDCEPGSNEQKQLRRQAQEQKRELDQLRQEQRQLKRRAQQRCRNC